MNNDNKFWLKDPYNIINSFNVIPKKENSLSKNLNNITRLILIIFILLVLFKKEYSLLFLIISISLIIIIYLLFDKKDNDQLFNNFNDFNSFNSRKEGFSDKFKNENINNKKYFDNNNEMNKLLNKKDQKLEKRLFQNIMDKKVENGTVCSPIPYKDGVFFGNTQGYKPWEFSNEDLYQQGANYSDTYNYNDPNSDGSCCNMKTPHSVNGQDKPYWTPKYYTPFVGVNPKSFDPPHLSPRIVEEGYWSYPTATSANVQVTQDLTGEVDMFVDKKKFEYEKRNCNNKSLLLNKVPTRMYTEEELNQPNNQLFMSTLEPHLYAYDDRIIGINNNSGITYTPEDEPFVRNTVKVGEYNYPIYTANTPQFVRDDVMPIQSEFQPARTNWSQKQKGIVAGPGTINYEDIYKEWPSTNTMDTEGKTYLNCKNPREGFTNMDDLNKEYEKFNGSNGGLGNERRQEIEREKNSHLMKKEGFQEIGEPQDAFVTSDGDINYPNNDPENTYDPRQNGYGDLTRAYSDVNLGQVNYYYSDIESHRRPVFVTRSKIDHISFTDPMNKTTDYYIRTASLDDVKETVEDDFLTKTTEFREDLMSLQMRKRNSEMIQLRIAPLQRAQTTQTFTNKY